LHPTTGRGSPGSSTPWPTTNRRSRRPKLAHTLVVLNSFAICANYARPRLTESPPNAETPGRSTREHRSIRRASRSLALVVSAVRLRSAPASRGPERPRSTCASRVRPTSTTWVCNPESSHHPPSASPRVRGKAGLEPGSLSALTLRRPREGNFCAGADGFPIPKIAPENSLFAR